MLEVLQKRVQEFWESKIVVDEYHLVDKKIVCAKYNIILCGHCMNIYTN